MKKVMKRAIPLLLTLCLMLGLLSVTALAADDVATINGTAYSSLNDALNASKDGDTIELLSDATMSKLCYNLTGKSVTISGSHTVTMTNVGFLMVNAGLTFDGCTVIMTGDTPDGAANIRMTSSTFDLKNGASVTVQDLATKSAFYVNETSSITLDAASLTIGNVGYTAMQQDNAKLRAALNILNGSTFTIDGVPKYNGLYGYNVTVSASTMNVVNCANQGLVRCSLVLNAGAVANVSNNYTGINEYSTNEVVVNDGAKLIANGNRSKAFMLQGNSTLKVNAGGILEVRENGEAWLTANADSKYPSKAAIAVGMWNGAYTIAYTSASVTFADGADVTISDNYIRGITNFGTVSLGSDTEIVNNGMLAAGETAEQSRIENGGGIYNAGTLTMSTGAAVYNNHAWGSGDDIFNADLHMTKEENNNIAINLTGTMTLVDASSFNATLSDCDHPITGWYYDGLNAGETTARWNAAECIDGREQFLSVYTVSAADNGATALKAAHGLYTVSYDLNGGSYNGSATVDDADYVAGTGVSVISNPTRTGMIFAGWTVTTDNESVTAPAVAGGAFTMPKANVLLTASWTSEEEDIPDEDVPLDGPSKPSNPDKPTTPDEEEILDDNTPLAGPATGDSTSLFALLAVLTVSALGVAVLVYTKKKEHQA